MFIHAMQMSERVCACLASIPEVYYCLMPVNMMERHNHRNQRVCKELRMRSWSLLSVNVPLCVMQLGPSCLHKL